MEILVESGQMKQFDRNTIEHFGVPSLVLMERAALGALEETEKRMGALSSDVRALLVCGFGNNGGDGLAMARMLWQKGCQVTVVMPPGPGNMSEETKVQKEILDTYGISILHQIPEENFDLVVDALFGIGISRDLGGIYREFVQRMNETAGFKTAIDIPSGICGDTGSVMGIGFRADLTVTFAFAKPGLLLFPGAEYAGEVAVRQIGIDRQSFLGREPFLYSLTKEDLGLIPSRKIRSNKGSYGRVLAIAGQKNMAGAAFFCAKAAYLVGAGLVKVLTAEENRVILQQLLPEAILETYAEKPGNLSAVLSWAGVILAGPGLGTGKAAQDMVRQALSQKEALVILDADGLNIAAGHLEWLKEAETEIIVTPHLGEMARLAKREISDIQNCLLKTAREFAKEYHVICVLKDARTVIALPDGRAWINTSGNNGMATAGSGDVLAGILSGLAAQGMEAQTAAPYGVFVHGLAGDEMVKETGAYSLMARDILKGIPQVLREVKKSPARREQGRE